MPRRRMHEIVAEEDAVAIERQLTFRLVADRTARAWAEAPGVEVIGVTGPLVGPLPRAMPYWRRRGDPSLLSLSSLDMVVWLSRTDEVRSLHRAFARVLRELEAEGVQHQMAAHYLSATVLDVATADYRGVICTYASCPKGKPACQVRGCGVVPFLRRFTDWGAAEAWREAADALVLWRRGDGFLAAASDLPPTPLDAGLDEEADDAAPSAGWKRGRGEGVR